jgi:hypothetical protein
VLGHHGRGIGALLQRTDDVPRVLRVRVIHRGRRLSIAPPSIAMRSRLDNPVPIRDPRADQVTGSEGPSDYQFVLIVSDRRHLWGARRKDDDDGLASEGEDPSSGYRRYQCRREAERRGDDEGHEAEESPSHKGAMRARGEEALEVQGVQRLSARS